MNDKTRITELEREVHRFKVEALESRMKAEYERGRAEMARSYDSSGSILLLVSIEIMAFGLGKAFGWW